MYWNVVNAVFHLKEQQLEVLDRERSGSYEVVSRVYGNLSQPDCFIVIVNEIYTGVVIENLTIAV